MINSRGAREVRVVCYCTSRHTVAGPGHAECMQALVELHADVLPLHALGHAPLKIAFLHRHSHIVQFLATCVAASKSSSSNILDANNEHPSIESPSQEREGTDHGYTETSRGTNRSLECAPCEVQHMGPLTAKNVAFKNHDKAKAGAQMR